MGDRQTSLPVVMEREPKSGFFAVSLPEGYGVVRFRAGDQSAWARIETEAGEFSTEAEALAHFEKEFGGFRAELAQRCLFIEDGRGCKIATVTAWFGEHLGNPRCHRVHWVAVVPREQGKGLGRALVCTVLNRFEELASGQTVYLTTSTKSRIAVGLYRQYGFAPYDPQGKDGEAWKILDERSREAGGRRLGRVLSSIMRKLACSLR